MPARKAKALVRDGRPAAAVRRRRAVRAPRRPVGLRPGLRSPTRSSRPTPRGVSEVLASGVDRRRAAATPTGCCSPSRRSPTTSRPGLAPDELCARVLATLGETLGWTSAPSGARTGDAEHAALHGGLARPRGRTRGRGVRRGLAPLTIAPGRGAARPRVRVPAARVGRRRRGRRQHGAPGQALRAGLTTAVAFPIALADDCAGVLEFFSAAIQEPDAQVAAMFATVGGQLAQYLERRRLQADESRRVEAVLRAERDRAQRYLDVAGTMIVVLDADGPGRADQPQGLRGARPRRGRGGRRRLVRARDPRRTSATAVRAGFDAADRRATSRAVEQLRELGRDELGGELRHDRLAQHGPARRRRRDHRRALVRRGRHGAARRRAADHLPRLPRRAHRAAEPHAARGAPRARARARAAHRRRGRAAAARPRQLQARQRLARATARATS